MSSDTKGLPTIDYTGPFAKALRIASYYGFCVVKPPTVTKEDEKAAAKLLEDEKELPSGPYSQLAERIALLREANENGWLELAPPLLVAYTSRGSERGERYLNLTVLGSNRSVAEILTLHVALTILQSEYRRQFAIDLNTMGSTDALSAFARDVAAFYRKRANEIPDHCQQTFRTNPLSLFACNESECRILQDDAPRSLSYLTDEGRKHFRDVVEYIDSTELPYAINHRLLAPRDTTTHTLFDVYMVERGKVEEREPSLLVATGRRTDSLAKAAGSKKQIPCYGVTLSIPKPTGRESYKEVATDASLPRVGLVQVGEAARLRAFKVLELLRKAGLNVYQIIVKDKISTQLSAIDRAKVPYVIIIGQKEALERAVIVRESESRSQKTVREEDLLEYLRNLK